MAMLPFVANTSSDIAMTDNAPAPPPANLTPAPTVGGENSDYKPDSDGKLPGMANHANNGNKPGEPDWVTHSGVDGRPYLTEEIYESPDKIELEDDDRCKPCIDLGLPCVTILKFPNPPALGDIDVCGHCAKGGKQRCGASKKAYEAHLRKMVEDEGENAISKRRARRVSNKPLTTDMYAATEPPNGITATGPRNLRRSLSEDSDTSIGSAPKRQKINRKKVGPQRRSFKAAPSAPFSTPATNDDGEKYDGRKDPAKVALRVEKMKATLAAKKVIREAEKAALAGGVTSSSKGHSASNATPKGKANKAQASKAMTDPKPTLKKPRTIQTPIRTRAPVVAPEDDFLHKDFVGTAPASNNKQQVDVGSMIRDHRRTNARKGRASLPNPTRFNVDNEVNALLGSIEQPMPDMDDEDDEDDSSGVSIDEAENQSLRRTLAKLEAREKKQRLREENEDLKKRIEELRRKSMTRREEPNAV